MHQQKKGFVPTRTQLKTPTSKGSGRVLDDKIPMNWNARQRPSRPRI